jgi:hypothetical protein
LPILAIVVPALVQVFTKPWVYVGIIGWFVAARIGFGVIAEEARKTIWSLWPFVLLIVFLMFALQVVRIYLREGQSKALAFRTGDAKIIYRVLLLAVFGIALWLFRSNREDKSGARNSNPMRPKRHPASRIPLRGTYDAWLYRSQEIILDSVPSC